MNKHNIKITVAMSGGVDSTITTWLLKQAGYHVEAIFMKNWEADDTDTYCNSYQDLQDVKHICQQLNIYLHIINYSSEYWNKVFNKCLELYKKGTTPNPDILCNKEIKFKILLNYILNNLNSDYMATGHYVTKIYYENQYYLLQSKDVKKDQTYFLYTLTQQQLNKVLFPLGNYLKQEVRYLANKLKFINAKKKSSVGICFIGKRKFNKFINKFLINQPGNIVNNDNKLLGKHLGLFYYTIGQRKGLNIKHNNSNSLPWYVIDKDIINNKLIIAEGFENKYLLSKGILVNNIHWINNFYKQLLLLTNVNFFSCFIKIRHGEKLIKSKVYLIHQYQLKILFLEPVYSIALGQSAVLYYQTICLGGGIIIKNFKINL